MTLFLPGVAIGDNLFLLLKFLTQPFVIVSSADSSVLQRLLALSVLMTVFLVWVRAQKTAISGGDFSEYLCSLPLTQFQWMRSNLIVLLLSNHLLWVLIIASYFYLITGSVSEIINNTLVIILLLVCQYHFIFSRNRLASNTGNSAWNVRKSTLKTNNLYLQMLFQSDSSTTFFRMTFLILLIAGFRLVAPFFAGQNDNFLMPYIIALEFLLAYFFSGFFITFKEQRQAFGLYLKSLPVSLFFWFKKDFFVVLMISLPFHLLLYVLLQDFISLIEAFTLFMYYVMLTIVSYPLRMKLKQQTFFSFMTLLVITIITIYKVS